MEKYFKTIQTHEEDVDDPDYPEESDMVLGNFTEDEDDICNLESERKTTKLKYLQKYKQEWELSRPWLKNESAKGAYCKLCKKCLHNNVSNLDRHSNSAYHKKKVNEFKNQADLPRLLEIQNQNVDGKDKRLQRQVTMVMYCVSNFLPFTIMDTLPALFEALSDPKESKIKCCSKTATELVRLISAFSLNQISQHLKSNKFSLIIDESTDISSKKCLVLVARSRKNNIVQDSFFGMIELEDSTANTIANVIRNYLLELEIPGGNLIGLGTDNAAVMKGELHGVKQQLKSINPNIFYIGCTCHSLNLCAKAAAKNIPIDVELLLKSVFNFFSHSSKRQVEFKTFQEYFNLHVDKVLNSCSTRWLSIQAAVDRILEQWVALQHYFFLFSFEDIRENSIEAVVDGLNDINKAYLFFLSYILNLVNKINRIFQSDESVIHILYPVIKEHFLTLLNNFIKKDFLSIDVVYANAEFQSPLSLIYCGIEFEKHQCNLSDETIVLIKKHILSYYIALCDQLKKRFSFDDQKIILLQYISPNKIKEGQLPSIVQLVEAFPFNNTSVEILNDEWRSLIMHDIKEFQEKDVVKFWLSLSDKINIFEEYMFRNLAEYMLTLVILPHSSAAAERKFSEMNLIKTKFRNKLNVKTVENLMFARCLMENRTQIYKPPLTLVKFLKKYKFLDGKFVLNI